MSEINNPIDISKKGVNRSIAVVGGGSSTWLAGRGSHLGKSVSKAVAMDVGRYCVYSN